MDIYWSVIYAIAGVGAALVVALAVAATLLLAPTLGGREMLRRRRIAASTSTSSSASAAMKTPAARGAAGMPAPVRSIDASRERSGAAAQPAARAA